MNRCWTTKQPLPKDSKHLLPSCVAQSSGQHPFCKEDVPHSDHCRKGEIIDANLATAQVVPVDSEFYPQWHFKRFGQAKTELFRFVVGGLSGQSRRWQSWTIGMHTLLVQRLKTKKCKEMNCNKVWHVWWTLIRGWVLSMLAWVNLTWGHQEAEGNAVCGLVRYLWKAESRSCQFAEHSSDANGPLRETFL